MFKDFQGFLVYFTVFTVFYSPRGPQGTPRGALGSTVRPRKKHLEIRKKSPPKIQNYNFINLTLIDLISKMSSPSSNH